MDASLAKFLVSSFIAPNTLQIKIHTGRRLARTIQTSICPSLLAPVLGHSDRFPVRSTMSNPSIASPADASATENIAKAEQPDSRTSADPSVQYVVVRRDLLDTWPTGSVIAQAVHASVAAIWASRGNELTKQYCGEHEAAQMHTVVLEAKNEAGLLKLADRLSENEVEYVLWKEQPEDFVTALAAWPYPRSQVKKHFSKFKLFK